MKNYFLIAQFLIHLNKNVLLIVNRFNWGGYLLNSNGGEHKAIFLKPRFYNKIIKLYSLIILFTNKIRV